MYLRPAVIEAFSALASLLDEEESDLIDECQHLFESGEAEQFNDIQMKLAKLHARMKDLERLKNNLLEQVFS